MMKKKKINRCSKKQSALDKEYSKLRKQFLNKPENAFCKATLPGCSFTKNLTIHHKKGRGPFLLDTSTWVTLCMTCHKYIEEHPMQAKEIGFSEDRLT